MHGHSSSTTPGVWAQATLPYLCCTAGSQESGLQSKPTPVGSGYRSGRISGRRHSSLQIKAPRGYDAKSENSRHVTFNARRSARTDRDHRKQLVSQKLPRHGIRLWFTIHLADSAPWHHSPHVRSCNISSTHSSDPQSSSSLPAIHRRASRRRGSAITLCILEVRL